jgi:hypothetical protein
MVVVVSSVVLLVQIGCIEERIESNGFCSTTNLFFINNPYGNNHLV